MKMAEKIGLHFEGIQGRLNSIVDVKGVEVGHETLISNTQTNDGKNNYIRTGVTAILPAGREHIGFDIFSGTSTLNGNGEATGFAWINESGMLSSPVMLTNTNSVGIVRDATLKWMDNQNIHHDSLPVVCEISDEYLNDIRGHHITDKHVFSALEKASSSNVEEGNVGGGTGAVCYEFKGGIGTSSRVVNILGNDYTVGVMVQANHGLRHQLNIEGISVGKAIKENLVKTRESGSIVFVVGTDAPLLPHQLQRLSRRAFLGLARTGSVSSNGSGDFSIAFSVANIYNNGNLKKENAEWLPNTELDRLFEGVVYATEESIINALLAAQPMEGTQGHSVSALPHKALKELLDDRK